MEAWRSSWSEKRRSIPSMRSADSRGGSAPSALTPVIEGAGALCAVAATWFVYPIRTEAVVRRRVADVLAALSKDGQTHDQTRVERGFRTAARRPKYSALSNARMERIGLEPMPSLRKALEEYFAGRT